MGGVHEYIFCFAISEPSNMHIVWKRNVHIFKTLACIAFADFYTLYSGRFFFFLAVIAENVNTVLFQQLTNQFLADILFFCSYAKVNCLFPHPLFKPRIHTS